MLLTHAPLPLTHAPLTCSTHAPTNAPLPPTHAALARLSAAPAHPHPAYCVQELWGSRGTAPGATGKCAPPPGACLAGVQLRACNAGLKDDCAQLDACNVGLQDDCVQLGTCSAVSKDDCVQLGLQLSRLIAHNGPVSMKTQASKYALASTPVQRVRQMTYKQKRALSFYAVVTARQCGGPVLQHHSSLAPDAQHHINLQPQNTIMH
eukprot:1139280-Pelagomonas_calceolata.AAC.1